MKILYVDLQYDYGQKARGPNQIGEIGFRQVFLKLGHEVVSFYYDSYLNNTGPLQSELLAVADREQPDLVFFCLYTDQFYPETLLQLKNRYPTMNWFGDDQWRFEKFTSKYAPLFSYSITTDPFSLPKYKAIGVEKVILSQWAALNTDASEKQGAYKYDVSFVGGAHSVRRWIVHEFAKQGIKVATFGQGWPSGPVSLEKMQEIFQSSKVNLNLSNSVNLDIRYLTHRFKNIAVAARSSKDVSQMKARNFEIPYFGGFQIAEYVPTLEMYFDIGKEIICYSNVNEAICLTKFYLENSSLREDIKGKATQRVRSQHTYLHRFQAIFESL